MSRDYAPLDEDRRFGETLQSMQQRIYDLERLLSTAGAGAPAGEIRATIAASAPTGWLTCLGQVIASADVTFPALWSAAPAAWKSGATLTLPDLRGRTLFGVGAGVYTSLGAAAGANARTLTVANLPPHAHDLGNHFHNGSTLGRSAAHTHQPGVGTNEVLVRDSAYNTGYGAPLSSSGLAITWGTLGGETADHAHQYTTGGPLGSTVTGNGSGTSTAIDTSPAGVAVNWIIKAH